MANIGLSKPIIAVYGVGSTSGEVEYSSAKYLGKAISLSVSLETPSDNILYADNAPAESDVSFNGGTITVGTDDISASVMKSVLGLAQEDITGVTGKKWNVYDDTQAVPYLGFGAIAAKQIGGTKKYVAVIFNKVQFKNINSSFTTTGETIEWQTPEIEASIFRDDNSNHAWQYVSEELDSEANALTALTSILGSPS